MHVSYVSFVLTAQAYERRNKSNQLYDFQPAAVVHVGRIDMNLMCAQYEIPDSWKVSSGDRNGALSLVERRRKPTNQSFAQPRGEGPKAGERGSMYIRLLYTILYKI